MKWEPLSYGVNPVLMTPSKERGTSLVRKKILICLSGFIGSSGSAGKQERAGRVLLSEGDETGADPSGSCCRRADKKSEPPYTYRTSKVGISEPE
ncbi:hypothetical protein MTP99_015381 [Tenebrio molitor]|jgi:hypothetical protein|nr:hypothetical protein MTP99_015381 [Tenebrio molitor]